MADDAYEKTLIQGRPDAASPSGEPRGVLRCVDTSVLQDRNGVEIRLAGTLVTVGRASDNTVALNAQGISRHHARITLEDGAWRVEDLGSTNGTRVNNALVLDRTALADGDSVAFGRVSYEYTQFASDPAAGGRRRGDVDLGAQDRTLIIRPPEDEPGRGGRARSARGGSNTGLWIVVVLAAVALAAGVARVLGVF